MQTTKVFAETARWLRYAEEDLITAETLLAQAHIPPPCVVVCGADFLLLCQIGELGHDFILEEFHGM